MSEFDNSESRKLSYSLRQPEFQNDAISDTVVPQLIWPSEDETEKVNIVVSLSLQEYTVLASCVDVGRDIAYGTDSNKAWLLWLRILKSMTICDDVANCVETSVSVQNALSAFNQQNKTSTDATIPQLLPVAQTGKGLLPVGYTCDTDHLCGMARFIVQNLNSGTEELIQQIENQTQVFEVAALFVDNFEVVSWFGSMLELGTWLQDQLGEYYNLAWSTLVEDDLTCELYCKIEPECNVTIDLILEAYESVISGTFTPPVLTDVNDLWDWLLTIDLQFAANKVIVAAFHYVIIQALRFGGKVLAYAFGIRTFEQMVQTGQDETDTYCAINCDCPSDEWCYSIPLGDMSNFDWSSASGNQYAGTLSGGVWNASLVNAYSNKITAIGIYYNLVSATQLSRVECDVSGVAGASPEQTPVSARMRGINFVTYQWDTIDNYNPDFSGTPKTVSMNVGGQTIDSVRFYQVVDNTTGTPSGNGSLTAIRIYGTGTPPAWAGNC